MQQLFIADLHLSPEHPRLVRGFLDLLAQYQGKIDQLYILGDWFEAWIGDDDHSAWLDELVIALQRFRASGSQIFFMHGNRDFALGQPFMNRFAGTLIKPERITIKNAELTIALEHGDALCTDDIGYQRFKKIIRNKYLLKIILALPLQTRRKIASFARKKSKTNSPAKPAYIMDVNEHAVQQVLKEHDVLIHGHTHRPDIHNYKNGKQRIVLGDWRENLSDDGGEAMIALLDQHGLQLINWQF
ncbi:UDP-2,3-diacylglucosamine diphosphatase [Alkanindiges sp. WGS2144]|uniref:UDP-2,3-diacylglucosamine diphosphatase n=1 Tax=Alkanindiges sp. WGS2144 TaxID=3366808 RepID=UPI003751E03D